MRNKPIQKGGRKKILECTIFSSTFNISRRDFRMHVLSGEQPKKNPIKWNRAKVNKVVSRHSFSFGGKK